MADNNRNWLDLISKLIGLIMGFITFVTAVVGFIKLWQGDTGLVTTVLLVVGVGGGILIGAYLAYCRYQQVRPPTKVIILVADFDGPEPEEYRVTKTVWENLSLALEKYDDVQVERLEQAFETSAVARAEGQKRKAAIVIWGWYGVTAEAVPLSVHFEVLRPPEHMPALGLEARGRVRTMAVAELESFTLQPQLSAEMAYLSLFTVGMARYAAEDWGGAIARFSDALIQTAERVPALDQSIVHFKRGVAYARKGDLGHAISDYDQAIQLQPNLALAYHNRGLAYYYQGDYDRAIADYTEAIALAHLLPDEGAGTYNNRGLAYAHKGDYDHAISDYDKAIQLQPDDASAYNNRGLAYYYQGDYDRAIADYDQAIKLEPEYADAYYNRGLAYYCQGGYDRAIADFTQAMKFQPGFAPAHYNRGRAYYRKGDLDRAIADFDQAIQLQPDYAKAYHNRGFAYADKGDYDRAIADYNKVIELDPENAAPYNDLAWLYADTLETNLQEAISMAAKAVALVGEDQPQGKAMYMDTLAWAYYKAGDSEKALSLLEEAARLTPDDEEIQEHLDVVRQAQ